MTRRAVRPLAAAAALLLVAACGAPQPRSPEIRLSTEDFTFRISADTMPPFAREASRWRVVVTDRETQQPVENGEGRIFATSHDNANTWNGFEKGDEVGTYYATLRFITAGEWAMAVQFRADSTRPLQRVDWIQEVRPARPLGS
ncbi:MAG TPA: hypothetical protein VFS08_02960 [Gemmatimonadaceae bacterium]|nr:hypothetical protein [Gemmatimonadaceae bacterium]